MDIATFAAQLLTALGVFAAVVTLVTTHERGRREFAAKLVWDWTLNARRNSRAATLIVDALNKQQCEAIFGLQPLRIDATHEPLIEVVFADRPEIPAPTKEGRELVLDTKHSAVLRAVVTHYLNLLESVFLCRQHRVADHKIIEQEFNFMIYPEPGKIFLDEYIRAAGGKKNYPAICGYTKFLLDRDAPDTRQRPAAG